MPVTTAAALGTGAFDGQRKTIAFGPGSNKQKHRMRWDIELSAWHAPPQTEFELVDSWIMDLTNANPDQWYYVFTPIGNPGRRGQSSYGWNASAIPAADAAFAAGLTLQECVSLVFWVFDPASDRQLASVLYPLDPGDLVDNTLIPDDHLSLIVDALPGQRRWISSGWQDSAVQASAAGDLAPHLYQRYQTVKGTEAQLERLVWQWRWIARPA